MFVQNFVNLSAAVNEFTKIGDDAKNNTVLASAGSNNNFKNSDKITVI